MYPNHEFGFLDWCILKDKIKGRKKQEKDYKTIDGVPVHTLYVGNIPQRATPKDVKHTFQIYGPVVNISLAPLFPNKDVTFGFVTFKQREDAARALNARKHLKVLSNKVFVNTADSWHQPVQRSDGTLKFTQRRNQLSEASSQPEELSEEEEPEVEETENEVPVENETDCPILKLNDDCLRLVFGFIPMVNRFCLDGVCRRWRNVNNGMWSCIKELDFTKPPLESVPLTLSILKRFISKCENIVSLNLTQEEHSLDTRAIASVAKHCSKLEGISFCNIDLNNRSLALLARSCPNLKFFQMEACTNCHDGELTSLVKKCTNLQEIKIRYNFNSSLNGAWMKHLNGPLRVLSLQFCDFKSGFLLEGIQNVKASIKELTFKSCRTLKHQDVVELTKMAPGITSLTLSGSFIELQQDSLFPIATLKSLVSLNLDRNTLVSDSFLQSILENCPHIKYLNLSATENPALTLNGLNAIVKLPELTHLHLSYILCITDAFLKLLSQKVTNLVHLEIAGCPCVSDDGCASVVTLCNTLEELDVSGCPNVTNGTVLTAIETAKMGSRSHKLKLIVGESGIETDLDWTSENIIIDESSTCAWHMRSDFEENLMLDEIDLDDLAPYPNPIDIIYGFDDLELFSSESELDDDSINDYPIWSD